VQDLRHGLAVSHNLLKIGDAQLKITPERLAKLETINT